jgi:HD-GYP domain-containing protein (c-di-GMP phosphodiesterase class II)
MINDRPYRTALATEKAFEILKNGAGTVWDANFVEYFIDILKNKKDLSKTV